jgi:hypothetical protein
VKVEQAEAADWVEARLAEHPCHGVARVPMHSISWQYFPEASQNRISAAMAGAGADTTAHTPLAWLRLEPVGEPGTAAILLTLWPGGEARTLGRDYYHGRFADWRAP